MVDRVMRMLPIVLRRLRVAGVASGKGHHATSFVHRGPGFARKRLERPQGAQADEPSNAGKQGNA